MFNDYDEACIKEETLYQIWKYLIPFQILIALISLYMPSSCILYMQGMNTYVQSSIKTNIDDEACIEEET